MDSATDVIFDTATGHMQAQIDPAVFGFTAQAVMYRSKLFQPKEELHYTVVSEEAAEAVRAYLETDEGAEAQVRDLINRSDWSYRRMNRYYHVIEKQGVESIIERLEVPGLASFYHALQGLVGQALALPPAHVTLYWIGDPQGIGLHTLEVFNQRVQGEVDPKELEAHT